MPRRKSRSEAAAGRAENPYPEGDRPVRLEVQRGGKLYRGQVVTADRWRPALGGPPPRDLAFQVVLLTRPEKVDPETITSTRVVVCIPAESLASGRVAETVAQYEVAGEKTIAPLPDIAIELFSHGNVLVGGRPWAEPSELFVQGQAREVLARLAALADLDGIGPDISSMRDYLESAQPPESQEELYVDRMSLLEQLVEERLWSNTGVWRSVEAMFELYKSKYVPAYLGHHRRYRAETATLRRQLEAAEDTATALRLLNVVEELGPPVGEAALTATQGLKERLVPCQETEQGLTGLATRPRCPSCGVAMTTAPPTEVVRRTLAALNTALAEQQRRLSSEAVRQILDRRDEPRLGRFLEVLRAADIGALATVMNEQLASFLRDLLGEASVVASWAWIQKELNDRFPEVGEEDTGAFGDAVGEILAQAIADAKKAHPNKRIRLRVT